MLRAITERPLEIQKYIFTPELQSKPLGSALTSSVCWLCQISTASPNCFPKAHLRAQSQLLESALALFSLLDVPSSSTPPTVTFQSNLTSPGSASTISLGIIQSVGCAQFPYIPSFSPYSPTLPAQSRPLESALASFSLLVVPTSTSPSTVSTCVSQST